MTDDEPPLVGRATGGLMAPAEGAVVGRYVRVGGWFRGLGPGLVGYLVHRRVPGGEYWPKRPRLRPDVYGRFAVRVPEGGLPGQLVICLVTVSIPTALEYDKITLRCSQTGDWTGVQPADIPVEELARVIVKFDPLAAEPDGMDGGQWRIWG